MLALPQALGDVRRDAGPGPARGVSPRLGEELLRVYVHADDAGHKVFCTVCGSSLFGGCWPDGQEISVRFGSLDGDPGIRPQYHTFVESRAVWDELPDDGLPRYPDELPPA